MLIHFQKFFNIKESYEDPTGQVMSDEALPTWAAGMSSSDIEKLNISPKTRLEIIKLFAKKSNKVKAFLTDVWDDLSAEAKQDLLSNGQKTEQTDDFSNQIGVLNNQMKDLYGATRGSSKLWHNRETGEDVWPKYKSILDQRKGLINQHYDSQNSFTMPDWAKYYDVDAVIETIPIKKETQEELLRLMPDAYEKSRTSDDEGPELATSKYSLSNIWNKLSVNAQRDILAAYAYDNA